MKFDRMKFLLNADEKELVFFLFREDGTIAQMVEIEEDDYDLLIETLKSRYVISDPLESEVDKKYVEKLLKGMEND